MADFNKEGYPPQPPGIPPNPQGYPPNPPGFPTNPPGYSQGVPVNYPAGNQPMPVTETYMSGGHHYHHGGPIVVRTRMQASEYPYNTTCPNCNAKVITAAEYKNGALTWVLCFSIAIFGGILGCFLIPFCVNATKDVVHRCPQCNMVVGEHKRV